MFREAVSGSGVTVPNPALRGYRIGGSTSSRRLPSLRLFTIARMRELVVTDEVRSGPA